MHTYQTGVCTQAVTTPLADLETPVAGTQPSGANGGGGTPGSLAELTPPRLQSVQDEVEGYQTPRHQVLTAIDEHCMSSTSLYVMQLLYCQHLH
jgi:hypothetical protein